MKIKFSDISPYVRYVRDITVDTGTAFPLSIPCDSRFFYTLSGTGEIEAGGTRYTMSKGDVLFFGAGTEYKILTVSDEVTYTILNFDYTSDHSSLTTPVPPKTPDKFRNDDVIEVISFCDAEQLSEPIYLRRKFDIADRILEIKHEFSRKILCYEKKISSIFSDILIECLREIKLNSVADGYEKINGILQFIHENYNKRLTNISIGDKFGFHPNYISYLIKSYTGTPLHKYVLNVKISRAVDLLDKGQLSVGEISDECGFCDIYYFSRIFKQTLGISPLEYRGKKNIK